MSDAVKQGLVTEAELDRAVKRLFTARFRLGMFDPPESYAYGRIPVSEVNSAEHRKLALRAAREAIVLLKNDRGFLPLSPSIRRIAVVGPTAELVQSLQGNYNGTPPDPVSPVAGIERRFKDAKVLYAQGSTLAEGFAVPIAHTALRTADGKEGLTGEYFSTPDLSGKPVAVRVDRTVNFNWDKAIPVPGLQRNDFSVRWTGTFTPPAPGDYKLGARVAFCYACESHEQFRLYRRREADRRHDASRGRRRPSSTSTAPSRAPFASSTCTARPRPASTSPGSLPPPRSPRRPSQPRRSPTW